MKTIRPFCLVPLLLLAVFTRNAHAMFAPWDIYDAELKALLGSDGCVRVRDAVTVPGTPPHVIRIDVCDRPEARALAILLRRDTIAEAQVQVFGPSGTEILPGPTPTTPRGWKALFDAGLGGNCFYIKSFGGEVQGRDVAFVEIANATLQFYIDSPSDPNGNATNLASFAFFDLLIPNNGFQLFTSADYVSGCGGNTIDPGKSGRELLPGVEG